MKARIVRIGNSKGIRIPKPLIEQTGLSDDVTIEAEGNQLVIRAARRPRAGWVEAFRGMAAAGDDRLLDGDAITTSEWDRREWQWR
jgi:antitoxin MazE